MAHFESKNFYINKSSSIIYTYLSDFRNFGTVMPEQIKDWQATEDTCKFTIPGMATISMRYKDKIEGNRLSIIPETGTPLLFELVCEFESINVNSSKLKVSIDAELNALLSMMASKPMQNLVDLIAQQIERRFN